MTTIEAVVVALWGAASVFVLWHGSAHWFLRRLKAKAQPVEEASETDEVARARLEMELQATNEAWDVLNRAQ